MIYQKKPIPNILKGEIGEIEASAWLMSNGYEVYRNCSQFGEVDLITRKNGEVMLIDVKTDCKSKNAKSKSYKHCRTKSQAEQGIEVLRVNRETRVIKFVDHKS
tara:strand:+ start:1320 stop:1631 length:312 start_codon:yes stop_codon:yes gene_type:complete